MVCGSVVLVIPAPFRAFPRLKSFGPLCDVGLAEKNQPNRTFPNHKIILWRTAKEGCRRNFFRLSLAEPSFHEIQKPDRHGCARASGDLKPVCTVAYGSIFLV